MDECAKCGMPLEEDVQCRCNPQVCYHCCSCSETCTCDCQNK